MYASKIVSYAQGFVQLQAARRSTIGPWITATVRCCGAAAASFGRSSWIASRKPLTPNPNLENLLLNSFFEQAVENAQESWRAVVAAASIMGIPVPAFCTALTYYDGYRLARLPANLLQAQRDYFGAHTYQRVDKEGTFHTEWLDLRKTPAGS